MQYRAFMVDLANSLRCYGLKRVQWHKAILTGLACFCLQLTLAPAIAQSNTAPATTKNAISTGPFLRIDPGAHTAMVRAAAFDAAKERVYTASDDKTVRIWQLPQGKLIGTIRVPILEGAEGQLYALSLSQDGRWLAVGGWTGWDWERRASVYIFDTQTEQLAHRHSVATWTITSLRFTPDGQHLAIGMHGQGGLIIIERASGKIIASDPAYQNKLMDMDFDKFGRLYTIGLDGFVRLYKQNFSLLARRAAQASKDAVALRVSPDGERLAIGFADAPVVELLNARDLSTAGVLKANTSRQKDLVTVGWSSDGQFVYAGGESAGGTADIYRWPAANITSNPQVISATPARINDLWALSKGRMLFITDAPSVGWVEPSGQVRLPITSSQWDFAATGLNLTISSNGNLASLTLGSKALSFDVSNAKLVWQAANGLQRATQQAAGWNMRVGQDLRTLSINGQSITLEEYEKVRSQAIASSRGFAVVGTEWALRSYNAKGELLWLTRMTAPIWATNISADGRIIVAAVGDGTLRWFAADSGRELLSVFPHQNNTDWVAWVPGGQYVSSPFGDKHIGWHINRGLDIAPDFVYAVQLERVLYRPDVVRSALDSAASRTSRDPSAPPAMTTEQMAQMAPPRIRMRLINIDTSRSIARLVIHAERAGPEIQDITLYVNDIPVTPSKDRGLRASESRQFSREYEVPLNRQINDIRVEAFTGLSMGLARLQAELPADAPVKRTQGDLYLLAIGASQFDGLPKNTWLSYAAKDADTLANALKDTPQMPYKNRFVRVLTDNTSEKPTRQSIMSALDFLKSAKAEDTVVVFLASHGVSDSRGNYYFVPRDAAAQDLNGLQAVNSPKSLLSWQVFFDALRGVAGQRILVVDTCQAKGIAGKFDANALIKRSASSQFALMLASGENEESQEYDPAGHGLFTYGLLSTLKEAQTQRQTAFSLRDWFTTSAKVVQKFRDRSIGPQTPQLLAPPILEQAVVLNGMPN
jgi:WD40 repeat protein